MNRSFDEMGREETCDTARSPSTTELDDWENEMSESRDPRAARVIPHGSEVEQRVEKVLDRSRGDSTFVELLRAAESMHATMHLDAAYLAEAVIAEKRRVADLTDQNQSLKQREAESARDVALKQQQVDRLHDRVVELEHLLETAGLQAEADRLAALTERDTWVERSAVKIRQLESENGRLAASLAELQQQIRPLDPVTDGYADPATALVIDGDRMVLEGWGNMPLSVARGRLIAALGRLSDDRDAPVEVVFTSQEGLDPHELKSTPVRVRALSDGVRMEAALMQLREDYAMDRDVAIVSNHRSITKAVPVSKLFNLIGMPSAVGHMNGSRSATSVSS